MLAVGLFTLLWKRADKHIGLAPHKFWSLVQSQDKPIVLMTTKGYLIKRSCYVFPYQGIVFYTDAAGTSAPDGVKLIGTVDSFSI